MRLEFLEKIEIGGKLTDAARGRRVLYEMKDMCHRTPVDST